MKMITMPENKLGLQSLLKKLRLKRLLKQQKESLMNILPILKKILQKKKEEKLPNKRRLLKRLLKRQSHSRERNL
jgi:hypothetical protein